MCVYMLMYNVCVCLTILTHRCVGDSRVLIDGDAVWRAAVRHLVQ